MTTPKPIDLAQPEEWWIAETLGSWKVFADKAHAEFCMRGCGYTDAELAAELIHVIEYSALDALKAQLAEVTRARDAASIVDKTDHRFQPYHDMLEAERAKLVEVTRERDEWKSHHDELYEMTWKGLKAERAKAERYRHALNKIASAGAYDGASEMKACAEEALTEAEGE